MPLNEVRSPCCWYTRTMASTEFEYSTLVPAGIGFMDRENPGRNVDCTLDPQRALDVLRQDLAQSRWSPREGMARRFLCVGR